MPDHDSDRAVAALREAGLRVTAPRAAVLSLLEEHGHVTADELTALVRERVGTVSRQAVYDVLTALQDVGLVRRIEPAGSPALFEGRAGDNHHHVVCRTCGAVADVDCAVGRRPCLRPSDAAGYDLDEAEVTWWGICPACQPPKGSR